MAAVTAGLTGVVALMAVTPGRLGGGGAVDVSLARIVSALVVCLLLSGAAAWAIKRGGGRVDWRCLHGWGAAPVRRIAVIEARRISAHADVCLFRCDGRDYLILSSATGQRVLHRADTEGSSA